ncbi:MAG: hypothetical protein HYY13_05805 [Nitrospirae bacterium]|nr:hypothetical protein [Nitrospirota bacterium]
MPLSPEEIEDLRDKSYWESLERSFRELHERLRRNPPKPMDLDTLIDWLTFMSELAPDRRPREFRTLPGKMRL